VLVSCAVWCYLNCKRSFIKCLVLHTCAGCGQKGKIQNIFVQSEAISWLARIMTWLWHDTMGIILLFPRFTITCFQPPSNQWRSTTTAINQFVICKLARKPKKRQIANTSSETQQLQTPINNKRENLVTHRQKGVTESKTTNSSKMENSCQYSCQNCLFLV